MKFLTASLSETRCSSVLHLTALLLLLISSHSATLRAAEPTTYDFLFSVSYYDGPTANLVWESALFRHDKDSFIQSSDSNGKGYKRQLEESEYRALIKKLTANGLLRIRGDKQSAYTGTFYKLTIVSDKSLREVYFYPSIYPANENSNIVFLIRTMRNSAAYFSPSL